MNDTHSSDIDAAERGSALNPEVIGMLRERKRLPICPECHRPNGPHCHPGWCEIGKMQAAMRGAETERIEAPLVKGGQGRECSPAMALLVLSACIALVAFVVIVLLSHPI